ncbi:MAG: SRPBCC family protein [Pseudomonadota bacterium]
MLYEEQQRILNQLQNGLAHNTTAFAEGIIRAPVTDLICTDLLAKEQQVFFKETPLLLGLSGDLPGPDTYLATSETGTPILLTRDHEGRFHAFLNVCRHRGVQVVPDGRGERNRFTCPFHAWTYRNTGDLIAVTRETNFGSLDKQAHGLVELPAQEKHNMLWVRPTPGDAFDVDDLLGGLEADMANWNLQENTLDAEQVIEADINWKLAIDTFGENYHFDVLHKETLSPSIIGNLQTSDSFGNNYRMVFASRQGFQYVTDNNLPISQWPYRHITLNVYFIYPNVIFLVDPAGVDLLRMYPHETDPGKSFTHHRFFASPFYLEEMRKQEQQTGEPAEHRFVGFNQIIVDEDYAVAASTQRNARSAAQTHFTFGKNEPALHHYHNAHRRGLGLPELEVE